MHIPDAYLSPQTQVAAAAVMVPVWAVAVKKTRKNLTSKQVPLLSIGAAFCFAIQMFNIPAIGGTTAHALGTALLAILLGPWEALLTITLTLAVQALFFGDGGVLSLGVNAFNMALIPSFVGSGAYRLLSGSSSPDSRRRLFAAGAGAYLATTFASLSAGILLGIQPLVAHDASGHALYFPFGLAVSIPAMLHSHLLIAAPAEAIITIFAVSYLWRNFPDLAFVPRPRRVGSGLRLAGALTCLLILTPLGLLASGSAWGEWDLAELKQMAGYAPQGIADARPVLQPLLPDYALPNASGRGWEILGYLISAIVGSVVVYAATRTLVRKANPSSALPVGRKPSQQTLPSFLTIANPQQAVPTTTRQRPWLERLLSRMRASIEETVMRERVARSPGLLQKVSTTPKAAVGLCVLIAIALIPAPEFLVAILLSIFALGSVSSVPMARFATRILLAVSFFGLILAVPVAFRSVTPGSAVFGSGPFALSDQGIHQAVTLLFRLACGIGLTFLWTTTTRWNDLVSGLRRLGLPTFFVTGITLAYRYLFVTVEMLEEMATARRSRQAGAIDKAQARTYAGAGAAILFSKSYAFTEEVHMAMRSRCFEGPTPPAKRRWTAVEVTAVGVSLLLVAFLITLKVRHAV